MPSTPEHNRRYYLKHREKEHVRVRNWREANRKRMAIIWMLSGAKRRAKKENIPFNLTLADIKIPKRCPVFGLVLEVTRIRGPKPNSPTLDRIDPKKGYVKGNVAVISFHANRMKFNGTAAEHQRIADWMRSVGTS